MVLFTWAVGCRGLKDIQLLCRAGIWHYWLLIFRTLQKHAGVDGMLTALQSSYWIIGARRLTKMVKSNCVTCHHHDSLTCTEVLVPMPAARVQRALPFSVTGVDFAGPLFCADHPGKKYYILLFTCGVVRAIHLELTSSLSLQEASLAFRHFAALHSQPLSTLTIHVTLLSWQVDGFGSSQKAV